MNTLTCTWLAGASTLSAEFRPATGAVLASTSRVPLAGWSAAALAKPPVEQRRRRRYGQDRADVASCPHELPFWSFPHWPDRPAPDWARVTQSATIAANWSGISSQAKWLAGRIVSSLPGIRSAR